MLLFGTILLLLFSVASTETCSNKCQLHDANLECWEETRSFFAHQLTKALNEFAAIEIIIGKWRIKHEDELSDHDTNQSISSLINSALDSNDGPLTKEQLVPIFQLIGNKTLELSSKEHPETFPVACPIPCDYVNSLWIYLFICSVVIVVLTIPIMLLHIHHARQSLMKYQLS